MANRIYKIPRTFAEEMISVDYAGDLTLLNQLIGLGIAQESNTTTDRTQRGPLTRWAAYYLLGTPLAFRDEVMTAMGIENPGDSANLVPGDANPFFGFIDSIDKSGNTIVRSGDWATLTPANNDDLDWLNLSRMILVHAVGGEIEGVGVYFVVPEASYESGMPAGFFNSSITELVDDAEATRQRKWSEWKSPNHEHFLIEGNYYIPSTSWGVHMKLSDWAPFYLSQQVNVVMDRPVVELIE